MDIDILNEIKERIERLKIDPLFYIEQSKGHGDGETRGTIRVLINNLLKTVSKNDIAVDLGCGPGLSFKELFHVHGFTNIVGIDNNLIMLDYVAKNVRIPGVFISTLHTELEHERISLEPESVRLIQVRNTTQGMETINNVFIQSNRILKPDGLLFIDFITADPQAAKRLNNNGNPMEMYIRTELEIHQLIAKYNFEILVEKSNETTPVEGFEKETRAEGIRNLFMLLKKQ